ncbi:MAG: hypothetical protein ACKOHK_05940, partial [Planctomycetia bacterium]
SLFSSRVSAARTNDNSSTDASVLELSLVRAADTRLEKSDETYPTPLDTPCYAGRADFRLGTFRYERHAAD